MSDSIGKSAVVGRIGAGAAAGIAVVAGLRDVPTVEQVLLEMPDYSAYAPVA